MDSDRWALRALTVADAQRWWELAHDDAELALGTPAFVVPPATPTDLHPRVATEDEAWRAGRPANVAVVAADEPDRMLGMVGWRADVPPAMRVADLGYAVHPDSRGRGVATAAVRLMVAHLVEHDIADRAQLDHSVENPASCRVALAAGLPVEGRRAGFLPLRDTDAPSGVRRHDVCLHGAVIQAPR